MGGKGTGGGIDFQARVLAWVYVHILARHPLSWVKLLDAAVPAAVSTETATAGDDVFVELMDSQIVLDAQVKKGFSRGPDFDSVIKGFASSLAADSKPHCLLIVDRGSSGTITNELPEDLNRMAGGRFDGLHAVGAHVQSLVESAADVSVVNRMHVITMDLLLEGSAHQDAAIQKLREVLENRDQAPQAWEILIADAVRLIREAGRRDRTALMEILGSSGLRCVEVLPSAPAVDLQSQKLLEQLLAAAVSNVTSAPSTAPASNPWADRLQLAKQLIDRGQPEAARPVLRDLSGEWERGEIQPTGDQLAQLHNLVGVAHLRFGETGLALAAFERAVAFNPSYFAPLVNAANLRLMDGEAERAFELAKRATELKPDSEVAWAVLCQCGEHLERPIDVPPSMASSVEVLAARGRGAFARDDWDRGIASLKAAVEASDPPDPQHLVSLANGLYHRWSSQVTLGSNSTDLQDAERSLSRALTLLEATRIPALEAEALLIRGNIRKAFGRREQALEDFRRAAAVQPQSWRPVFVQAEILVENDNSEEALRILAQSAEADSVPQLLALKARALALTDRTNETRTALERSVILSRGTSEEIHVYLMAVETAVAASLLEVAEQLLQSAPREAPSWQLALFRARLAVRKDDLTTARREYEESIVVAGTAEREIRLEFAITLLRAGHPRDAVVQFELGEAGTGTELVRKHYARALTEVGEWSKAAVVADEARREGIQSRWALELAAEVAERRGELAERRQLLEQLQGIEPQNAGYTIHLAETLLRQDDRERAVALLDELRIRDDLNAYEKLALAELYIEGGRPEAAIPLAFSALRRDPDNERVQIAYLNIFLQRSPTQEGLDPVEVGPGTHVVLEDSRGKRIGYTILPDGPVSSGRGEYLPSDQAVEPLLGKRVGEHVIRRKGQISEAEYTLAEIKSAYVHAFQEILHRFEEQHPESTQVQAFHVGEEPTIEDFTPLIRSLEETGRHAEEVLDRYKEHGFPLGTVAHLLSRSIPIVYAALAGVQDRLLLVEFATEDLFEQAVTEAQSATRAVLTRSALMTLHQLDLLDWVQTLGISFIGPRSLLQELEGEVEELQKMPGRAGTLATEGGRLVLHEESEEDKARHLAARVRLLDWARNNMTVVALPLAALDADPEKWLKVLGKSSFDAYALAAETSAPLFADDLGLRRIPVETFPTKPTGFSTVALLTGIRRAGKLSPDSYHRHLLELIELNHFFVPVTADLLVAALVRSGYHLNASVLHAFDRLRGSYSATPPAVAVSAEVLRKLAVSSAGIHLRMVTTLILECLSDEHPMPQVITALEQLVDRRLELLPLARDKIADAIRDFLAARALRLD